jgi:cytosine deaminase
MGFVTIPAGDVRLAHATVSHALLDGAPPGPVDADGLVSADIDIRGGRIAAVAPAGTFPKASSVDLDGGMVWPGFVDLHTHLDKSHIWPRAQNSDGSFYQAATTVLADREANWNAEDVRRRFDFSLRCAYAHGTAAIRTHIDSLGKQAEISWGVFRQLRAAWAGKMDIQATSLMPMDAFASDFGASVADIVAKSGGQLGAVTRLAGDMHVSIPPEFHPILERIFQLAEDRHLDLDFHVDESGEQGAVALGHIARTAIRRRFKGKILCGHCCSLAVQPEALVKETIAACAEAGLAIVSLPMCNIYLQDRRPGRTPRWRGVTLLHELKAAGVPVSVASDNTRDPFYGFGDNDMHEVYTQATRIAHLDRPYADWPKAVAATPASVMGLKDRGTIGVGRPADLVLFRARNMSELLSRRQPDRVVLRQGKAIDTTPPDYRELDDLFARKQPSP